MNRPILMVKDITSDTPRPWTVKVTVADKTTARSARNSPKKYQRFVLTDEEDNRVQLTLFGDRIAMFGERLQMYRTYYLSDAIVKDAPPQYRIGANCFQWSLHTKSLVKEIEKTAATITLPDIYYTPLKRINDYTESGVLIDILVVDMAMLPVRSVTTKFGPTTLQEIIVLDKSLCPVLLTLWGSFVAKEAVLFATIIEQMPVLSALHVQISSYNGLSINSRVSITFHVKPPTNAAIAMRNWLQTNVAAVDALKRNPELASIAKSFGQSLTRETTPLNVVKTNTQTRLFHINCRLQMLNTKQNFLTKKCNSYSKPTSAEIRAVYTCNFRTRQGVVCLAGLRAEINAIDDRAQLPIVLYDQDIATFFHCDYETLVKSQIQKKTMCCQSIWKKTPASNVALTALQTIDDLTPAEKQPLQNIAQRLRQKDESATLSYSIDAQPTTSKSTANICTPASSNNDYPSSPSETDMEASIFTDKSLEISSLTAVGSACEQLATISDDSNAAHPAGNSSGMKRPSPCDFISQTVKRELFPRNV